MNATLFDIAALIEGEVIGDKNLVITSLAPIDNIGPNALVFAEGSDNLKVAQDSNASAILVASHVEGVSKPTIKVANPFMAFVTLLYHFYPERKPIVGIHPTVVINENVVLGTNVSIGPYVIIESGTVIGDNCCIKSHVYIGHDVSIGADSVLHPHVTIYEQCVIGERVIIHASTVIGSDGFGYRQEDGLHLKVPHVGHVVIESDVEIGANTVIDRAVIGATKIGEGTKIDNLVQIAHSVKLGKHNIFCAFTGIAGSTTSGNHVIFAANVGVSDHVRIDDGVVLGARAGVPPRKHLKHGNVYWGNPARPRDKAIEQELATTRIPLMRRNLKALTEKVAQLSERLDLIDEETTND